MSFQQTSVSWNIDSGMPFGKICQLFSVFVETGVEIIFQYLRNYKLKM
jgi:hypothetical protein